MIMRKGTVHKNIKTFLESLKNEEVSKVLTAIKSGDSQTLKVMAAETREYSIRGSFPPEEFATEVAQVTDADLSFLYKTWKMPFGLEERAVESLMTEHVGSKEVWNALFEALTVINPELNVFESMPDKDLFVVIGGCCSRMTVDDIVDYTVNKTEYVVKGDQRYKDWKVIRKDGLGTKYKNYLNFLYSVDCVPGYFPSMSNLARACEVVRSAKD
jgi:hypothetical protein